MTWPPAWACGTDLCSGWRAPARPGVRLRCWCSYLGCTWLAPSAMSDWWHDQGCRTTGIGNISQPVIGCPHGHFGRDLWLAHGPRYRNAMMPVPHVVTGSHSDQFHRRQINARGDCASDALPALAHPVGQRVELVVEV